MSDVELKQPHPDHEYVVTNLVGIIVGDHHYGVGEVITDEHVVEVFNNHIHMTNVVRRLRTAPAPVSQTAIDAPHE